MTDLSTPKLEALLAAADWEPAAPLLCSHTMHRKGCEVCESPESRERITSRRQLERLGFTNNREGRALARALLDARKQAEEDRAEAERLRDVLDEADTF